MGGQCGSNRPPPATRPRRSSPKRRTIITWAMGAQADPPAPSTTVDRTGLDVMQGEAAASVAGHDRLVLVVGPAGAGKTRMLAAAGNDLHDQRRQVLGSGADSQSRPHPRA